MREDFKPLRKATAVCHEPNTAWSITPYFKIQNRAHDCGMILDPKLTVSADKLADECKQFTKVYIACPETVDDGNKIYNLRYRKQLGMGCFPDVGKSPKRATDAEANDDDDDGTNDDDDDGNIDAQYVVIIDAGSSGSRVYVYKWEKPAGAPQPYKVTEVGSIQAKDLTADSVVAPDPAPAPVPAQVPYWVSYATAFQCGAAFCDGDGACWLKRGISTLGHDTATRLKARVEHHLYPLLAYAQHIIHEDHGNPKNVGLFVGATGGMRALGSAERIRIELYIKVAIRTYKFAGLNRVPYETISGKVEGIFGWAAANYEENANTPATFGTGTDTCGYVEMGGQTMQLAFHSEDLAVTQNIHIGRNFHVFAHCWEHHGADAAWQKHRDSLYNGSAKPQIRPSNILAHHHHAARRDNCLPTSVRDDAHPNPPGADGYTGNGLFIACVHEILSLAGSYFPNADGTMEPRLDKPI
ncbi:nucleoside phosphatase family-domain-containing protein [Terfezia claveryi]|nr:nucleoside phosphatase family-domain-containing protein [Terfezia claveryi]